MISYNTVVIPASEPESSFVVKNFLPMPIGIRRNGGKRWLLAIVTCAVLLSDCYSYSQQLSKKDETPISYIPQTKIFKTVILDKGDEGITSCELFKIGSITKGKYKNGQLVLVVISYNGPQDKG